MHMISHILNQYGITINNNWKFQVGCLQDVISSFASLRESIFITYVQVSRI